MTKTQIQNKWDEITESQNDVKVVINGNIYYDHEIELSHDGIYFDEDSEMVLDSVLDEIEIEGNTLVISKCVGDIVHERDNDVRFHDGSLRDLKLTIRIPIKDVVSIEEGRVNG